MKKIIIVILASMSLFSGVAYADIVNVLSQEYGISIYATDTITGYNESIIQTSTTPLSGSYNGYLGYGYASADGGVSSVSAFVSDLSIGSSSQGYPSYYDVYGMSSAKMSFSPLVSRMLVSSYGYGQYTSILLFDKTEYNGLVYYMEGGYDPSVYISYGPDNLGMFYAAPGGYYSSLIKLDISHIYSIELHSEAYSNQLAGGYLRLQSVPEPTTMLLLGLGLAGLAGVKRRLEGKK